MMTHQLKGVPACPLCESPRPEAFFEMPAMPVLIGVQYESADEALRAPRGDLRLLYCASCGYIWNDAFDPASMEYSQHYDNSLDYSGVFRQYSRELARDLVERHGLRGRRVLEIGCGKGKFIAQLCREGMDRGIGFDPSYEADRADADVRDRLEFVQDYYSERHAEHQADLVCCRHVLEHIPQPHGFLSMVRRAIADAASVVYFEVPNARFILRDLSVWDIIYEHVSYFALPAITTLFRRCGFEVLAASERYGGQFLGIEARPAPDGDREIAAPPALDELSGEVARFQDRSQELLGRWRSRLDSMRAGGRRAALWGAGAKAVSFLNFLRADPGIIPAVVDINPFKQGKHLAGTGQRVVAPEDLREIAPDVIILMNPLYRDEVAAQLQELGLKVELIAP